VYQARTEPSFEQPWPKPAREDCFFYHVMHLPEAGVVGGEWDIAPYFDEYIGQVPLAGKRVLDIGAASGFVGFEAERRGAEVIAFDLASAAQIGMVPFAGQHWHEDRAGWNVGSAGFVRSLHNAWWYAWHEYGSRARCIHGELGALAASLPRQEVVIAGAFIEHMSDPVTALGHLCRLATETVIIGFTPVAEGAGRFMRPITEWTPGTAYAWWVLSEELYRAVFDACGFEVMIVPARAVHRGNVATRSTLVARRR
jgi:O-methyltransferase